MKPADLQRLNAHVFADPVARVHYVIARSNVAEMPDPLARRLPQTTLRAGLLSTKYLSLRENAQPRRRYLKAARQLPSEQNRLARAQLRRTIGERNPVVDQ